MLNPLPPEKLRADAIVCLKAGPEKWADAGKTLSPEIRWLCQQAKGQIGRSSADIALAFKNAFAPKSQPYADWASMGDVVREAYAVLWSQHQGFQHWKAGLDEAILIAFPASEMLDIKHEAPADWQQRWQLLGGKITEGRCVAHKLDPVWEKFSDFGQPHEPFEWTGSLGQEDVSRREAKRLGVAMMDDLAKRILPKQPQCAPEPTAAAQKSGCLGVLAFGVLAIGAAASYFLA